MMSAATATSARSGATKYPFTATQWQELEHQALIFKYMVSGMPIPPDLLYTVRRSLDSSLSSKLLLHHHQPQLGWNSCFQMGYGRKIDPEPGRCRRTDGKKWRCSKEAYPDSKYCERHMHRGRNRSRKPVEPQFLTTPTTINTSPTTTNTNPPTGIPISSIPKNHHSPSSSPTSHHSFSCLTSLATSSESYNINNHPAGYSIHHPMLYPHSSCSRPQGIRTHDHTSSQDQNSTTTNFLLDSSPYSHASKGYRYGEGGKEEVDEHAFFSEASGTIRNLSGDHGTSSWQLAPDLTMGSALGSHLNKQRGSGQSSSYLQLQSLNHDNNYNNNNSMIGSRQQQKQEQYYGVVENRESDHHQPKKVMHHFFDEWPPKDNKDSCWPLDDNNDHKMSKIQLSISMPNAHDFFMTRNGK